MKRSRLKLYRISFQHTDGYIYRLSDLLWSTNCGRVKADYHLQPITSGNPRVFPFEEIAQMCQFAWRLGHSSPRIFCQAYRSDKIRVEGSNMSQ